MLLCVLESFQFIISVNLTVKDSKLQRTENFVWIHLSEIKQVVLRHEHDQSGEEQKR